MRLKVMWVDMRGGYGSSNTWETDVIDEDTGKKVGFIYQENKPAKRYISLFDGKYVGHYDDIDQCTAFAKGVEAVFNHAFGTAEKVAESSEAGVMMLPGRPAKAVSTAPAGPIGDTSPADPFIG